MITGRNWFTVRKRNEYPFHSDVNKYNVIPNRLYALYYSALFVINKIASVLE